MSALTFHLPLVLILLGAVNWLFVIAAWKPQWFEQTVSRRLFWSAVEGVICGLIWSFAAPFIEAAFEFSGLLNGLLAGFSWGAMSFYGKGRFHADAAYEKEQRINQIFGR